MRRIALVAALVPTGLAAGFFYAYACSVSLGLARLDDDRYVAAMQEINATVRNPVFALSFFGALVALALALGLHARVLRTRAGVLVVVAFVAYAAGAFALTLGVNVPLNDELAAVPPGATDEALARARASYEDAWNAWNAWNAVRAGFATLALGALALALDAARRPGREPQGGGRGPVR